MKLHVWHRLKPVPYIRGGREDKRCEAMSLPCETLPYQRRGGIKEEVARQQP